MSDHSASPPPLGPEETDDLAGEYVLGTLSAEQRLDVERRLPEDPKLQEAIWAWERRLQPYTAMVEPVTPSNRLWQRITRTLDDRETSRSSAEERATHPGGLLNRLWHDLTLWRGVSLASIIVAIGLAATLALGPGQTPSSRYLVVLMTPQHTQAGWIVQASSPRRISLKPIGTFEIPPGKALEFWTKADDWSGPVSLGLVEPGETRQLSLDDLPPLEDNQLFELTLEDDSGSPLDRPTGPIQFIGRAVEL
ncbi:anti-sigma factor [Salinicola acroporae]|uniref:RNA polymerase subunit sigma-70 n=1 Tax=Salinicola acroporae TaxID=1541440 RepID=A0ABT6I579_9GAMM|nr:anti-sigma factor [Salinicola acroporae]MDH4572676.1 RNA polymerase subunit sigma-70 [Salinicola acroporae]